MEEQILAWFAQYTYQPLLVYTAIFGMMFICSLGVPIPEEVTILSAGIVGHMALNPQDYPPPYPGAQAVHPYTLAFVTFGAVLITDFFIFWMGRFFGGKIFASQRFKKYFSDEKMFKVKAWAKKYGSMTPAVFRFIPGVRFPGHLMCGALGVPPWAFIVTDGLAALVSVPTQVLLVSYYGHDIIMKMKEFKIGALIVLSVLIALYFLRRFITRKQTSVVL